MNTTVALHRKQEEVKATLDRFVQEKQKGIIEDLKQKQIGRASE